SIGTGARSAGDLFGDHSMSYSIAPQLSWTLFDGLARNYRVAEAKLQFETAIDSYNLTVMNAVGEVDNALQEYDATLKSIELQEKVVEQSEKALRLAINLYKTGLTAFSNVVDGQMSWLTSQNQLVSLEGEALTSLITIYQALGGGWQSQEYHINK
ncbi:MAG: TolC family protein, partial [Muribaculaceae bacterium]|nr:TolC family protein [Muribaculaceae bacterium]